MSLDSLSNNFEMWYDRIQQLDQSNISQFTKKIPSWGKGNLDQIWDKIMQPGLMIHSLGMFLNFCAMMRHNRQTKAALVIFLKKSFLGATWTQFSQKLQSYITLTDLKIFRNILA